MQVYYKIKLFSKRLYHRIKYIPSYLKEIWFWKCETCQRCGSVFRIMWDIKNEIWYKVIGNYDGCYCLDCFIKIAEKQKIKINLNDMNIIEIFYEHR